MRKVKFKAYPAINNSKTFEGEGLFHCWGSSFTEFESGAGNFTIAIVETKDGKIWNVNSEDLQFLTPPIDNDQVLEKYKEDHVQKSDEEVKIHLEKFYPELYKDTLIDEGRLVPVESLVEIFEVENTLTINGAFAAIKKIKNLICK